MNTTGIELPRLNRTLLWFINMCRRLGRSCTRILILYIATIDIHHQSKRREEPSNVRGEGARIAVESGGGNRAYGCVAGILLLITPFSSVLGSLPSSFCPGTERNSRESAHRYHTRKYRRTFASCSPFRSHRLGAYCN